MAESPLGTWLREECDHRKLSWRAASLNAGLGATAVYGIIRGMSVPDPATLRKLADYFAVPYQYLMELAGHLPPGGGEQTEEEADIRRALRSRYRDLPAEALQEIEDFIEFVRQRYERER